MHLVRSGRPGFASADRQSSHCDIHPADAFLTIRSRVYLPEHGDGEIPSLVSMAPRPMFICFAGLWFANLTVCREPRTFSPNRGRPPCCSYAPELESGAASAIATIRAQRTFREARSHAIEQLEFVGNQPQATLAEETLANATPTRPRGKFACMGSARGPPCPFRKSLFPGCPPRRCGGGVSSLV